jgi:hypothetical protein
LREIPPSTIDSRCPLAVGRVQYYKQLFCFADTSNRKTNLRKMADPGAKKRKRDAEAGAKPSKKVAIAAPASAAKVDSILRPKSSPPVIGRFACSKGI